MTFSLKRASRTAEYITGSLRKRLILFLVRLSGFSLFGIRLVRAALLPLNLIRQRRSWRPAVRYVKIMFPGRGAVKNLIQYYRTQVDQNVWSILVHNAWDSALKYNDFSRAADLRTVLARGKGCLLLGLHYGPAFSGFSLNRMGFNPAILSARVNIPDLDGIPFRRFLTKETIFRGTHDGMAAANHSEKRWIRMMMSGRPGLILIDGIAEGNFIPVDCLGIRYPVGMFAFKLALTHAFPVAVIWFSKIPGKGYRLNFREIEFAAVEEGASRYGALLEQIVRTNPFLWNFGPSFSKHCNRTMRPAGLRQEIQS
jgi:hypothetical protein